MKNKYQEALSALSFGLTTKKNANEIWRKNRYGDNVTVEGRDNGRYIERTFYFDGNVMFEGEYNKDGKLDGVSKHYHSNGNVASKDETKDGKLDGVSREYYKNGAIRQVVEYKDNQLHGTIKTFNKNGSITEEEYKNGLKDGTTKYYRPDGSIRQVVEYKDGKCIRTVKS